MRVNGYAFFGLEIVVLVMVAAIIFECEWSGKAQYEHEGDVRLLSERESKED